MTNDEVERAIEFLLKWQAEYSVRLDKLTDRVDKVAERVEKLTESTERVAQATEGLFADRERIVQLIELQSRRLDRQDL